MNVKKSSRKHNHVDVSSLNMNLDMMSAIMKRIDKVRETTRNFNQILKQIREITHNKGITLQSLESDVAQWWLHIEQSDSLKF